MSASHATAENVGINSDAEFDYVEPVRGSQGLLQVGMIWLAAKLVLTTRLTVTLFVPDVSFVSASIMIIVGSLLGVTVLTLIGDMGIRTGLPAIALTRGAFGIRGSLL